MIVVTIHLRSIPASASRGMARPKNSRPVID
jgi:hypothetical protein